MNFEKNFKHSETLFQIWRYPYHNIYMYIHLISKHT
ncbi:hypothetical protein C7460_10413 [Marinoscillum furvescens DSM 4134]|uniref:Uncharacterized protein n=1 Tax=Marinoscillum furvescens DSM 4134 TaxID=1122208 RepID=A0A3D9L688_MARFU|nr:hypothetical protein C7460_10413 [Marinoscillum furvescens DSM 4134]